MGGLTPRRRRFVEEYLIDRNGAQAAIRAGYSSRSACEAAYELLSNSQVRAAVEAGTARKAQELNLKRHDAILALVEAAEIARKAQDARTLLRTWREIALLLGFYPPTLHLPRLRD